jgi:hypothetical protein
MATKQAVFKFLTGLYAYYNKDDAKITEQFIDVWHYGLASISDDQLASVLQADLGAFMPSLPEVKGYALGLDNKSLERKIFAMLDYEAKGELEDKVVDKYLYRAFLSNLNTIKNGRDMRESVDKVRAKYYELFEHGCDDIPFARISRTATATDNSVRDNSGFSPEARKQREKIWALLGNMKGIQIVKS